jgi:hypothetical protein
MAGEQGVAASPHLRQAVRCRRGITTWKKRRRGADGHAAHLVPRSLERIDGLELAHGYMSCCEGHCQHVRVLEEEERGGAEANVLSRTESMRSSKTILPRATKHCRRIHRSCPAVAKL